jgi:hypothetical protein
MIDLTKDSSLRSKKTIKMKRRTDKVEFTNSLRWNIRLSSDYDLYFKGCMDSNIQLNTKGPYSNLFWSFKYLIK